MGTRKLLSLDGLAEYDSLIKQDFSNLLNNKSDKNHTHTIANVSTLQSALDGKAATGHTHNYAGSSSAGGAATSANKLNTNAGSATQPVYFSNGIPVATTYTLGKSVPSDAKFTDTTYSVATTSANGLMSSTDKKRVDSISGTYSLGSFASKTVADLQSALDTWLNSYVNIANSSASFQASQDWVTAWNSGNTATTISAGGTWTVTNIAPYSTKSYAQLRISYYSDEWVVYVHRSNGTWGTAHQAAYKDDLTSKQNTITGGATTITGSNLTTNRALISNGSGKVAVSAVTSTELGYLDGVTSNVQTQLDGKSASGHTHTIANISELQSALDGKSASSHTHNYAGSSKAGGPANVLDVFDTRNVNETPTEITNKIGSRGVRFDFKSTSTVGLNNGTYAAVMSIAPWSDVSNWSGGKNTQLGFCDDGRIQVRKGNSSGWTSWNTLIDSSTIGSQSVKYATSAGSATKATQDASGNTITSTYATKTELDTAKSTLQTSINGKANSSHTHTIANITNLQSTLDGKSSTSHTHNYAGSSSAGGSATSAVKLDTSTAGDANTPVYFSGGKPVACTSLDLNTSGSSASCTGNSATATKLQTARTIGLGTGATGTATSFNGTANITIPVTDVKESYLSWGGKNLSGSVSPIDAACSNIHSANRFALAKAEAITI